MPAMRPGEGKMVGKLGGEIEQDCDGGGGNCQVGDGKYGAVGFIIQGRNEGDRWGTLHG